MSLIREKARIVTFRITAVEYQLLAKACVRSGARSLSEFSRDAILDRVKALDAPTLALTRDLNTLGKELGELDLALRDARSHIARLLGPASSESDVGGRLTENGMK